jgi:hypothetical protein
MWIKFKLSFFTVFVLCFLCVQTGFADNKDKVVAKGGDFVMTEGFVRAFQEYYAERGHTTTREFLFDAALRDKLFAHQELSTSRQGRLEDSDEYSQEYIHKVVGLKEDYVFRLLNNYPVDDKIVLSYYRSYPEKFIKDSQQTRQPFQASRIEQPLDPGSIAPLDDEFIGLIRLRIAASKRQQIINEEMTRLKDKYQIEVLK